jgi:hypothetical protein
VAIEVGKTGQFDVIVDGETVASRGGNVFSRLFGAGWPDKEDVLAAVEQRLAESEA